MRILLSLPLAAALAACALPDAGMAAGLAPFEWANRVLLVFATPDSLQAQAQRRIVAAAHNDFAERDMVVLLVEGDRVEPLFGDGRGASAAALRRDACVVEETDFAAVLIGKDGGVKLREDHPVSAEALFGLVDSMPMRATEARR